jgi:hypothetical protein
MKRLPRTIPMFFLLFGLVLLALPAFAANVPASPFPPL